MSIENKGTTGTALKPMHTNIKRDQWNMFIMSGWSITDGYDADIQHCSNVHRTYIRMGIPKGLKAKWMTGIRRNS